MWAISAGAEVLRGKGVADAGSNGGPQSGSVEVLAMKTAVLGVATGWAMGSPWGAAMQAGDEIAVPGEECCFPPRHELVFAEAVVAHDGHGAPGAAVVVDGKRCADQIDIGGAVTASVFVVAALGLT